MRLNAGMSEEQQTTGGMTRKTRIALICGAVVVALVVALLTWIQVDSANREKAQTDRYYCAIRGGVGVGPETGRDCADLMGG